MRKVIYSIMTTLDGFIARPGGELDWAIIDEELHRFINDRESEFDIFLYGRRTYEMMAGFWPTADSDPSQPDYIQEYARIWKSKSIVVFSRNLEQVEGGARLVKENISEEIMKLKAQPGKDMAVGGAEIAATFMRMGLIDEYELYIHPTILGKGKPLFPAMDDSIRLRLVESRTFGSGVVLLRYQLEGKG
ncbi:MAG: dihydrofolate reductase [Chloroflexota bacterium]|nr:MAG: dihydrofolate reductase [Chloroflexota bacterium]